MSRPLAVLGSLAFLALAPGTVIVVVPWWLTGWRVRPPLLGVGATRAVGAVLCLAAVPVLLDAFARFAWQGRGTPAPVLPTRDLVVTGLYRYVRNPMYVAVVAAVLGQGLLLGAAPVVAWALALWLGFHLFVVGYEEPTLRRTFGVRYAAFAAAVPRWIPRVRPWRPDPPPRA